MARTLLLALTVSLAGCGTDPFGLDWEIEERDGPVTKEDGTVVYNEGKPWVKREFSADVVASAGQREAMRFVASGGQAEVTVTVGRRDTRWTVDLDKAAFRVGDVPTLDHPIGYVALDASTLTSTDRDSWSRPAQETVLRRLGSPVQILLDVHSVGDFKGRLATAGSEASGEIVGLLQIDDRATSVSIPATFRRPSEDALEVVLEPTPIDLSEWSLADELDRLSGLLGAGDIQPTVRIGGTISLSEFTGERLPMVVRTPVTVQTVDELREKLDAEIDDDDAARRALLREGLDPRMAEMMGEGTVEGLRDVAEVYAERRRKAELAPKKETVRRTPVRDGF